MTHHHRANIMNSSSWNEVEKNKKIIGPITISIDWFFLIKEFLTISFSSRVFWRMKLTSGNENDSDATGSLSFWKFEKSFPLIGSSDSLIHGNESYWAYVCVLMVWCNIFWIDVNRYAQLTHTSRCEVFMKKKHSNSYKENFV